MDVESVRSGRSEKSDRSRRLKRIQRSSASNNQNYYQMKNGIEGCIQNASPSQSLIQDQHMQHCEPSHQTMTEVLMPNMNQTSMNMFTQQNQNIQSINSSPYNVDNWIPSNIPMNSNYINCSQASYFAPNSQGWMGQPYLPAYPQQMMQQQINNQYVRAPLAVVGPGNQMPQQLNQCHLMPSNQHPLNNNTNQLLSSQIMNCQMTPQKLDSYAGERIDSQVPHDESAWVEEATAVTGATSETGLSGGDNFSRFGARYGLATSLGICGNGNSGCGISGAAAALIRSEADDVNPSKYSNTFNNLIMIIFALCSMLSPIIMLMLPVFPFWIGWSTDSCEPSCEGHLISISIKLVLLLIALWFIGVPCKSIFAGDNNAVAVLPRIRLCRTIFMCLVMVVLFAFWLFYTVRIIQPRESDYMSIVLYVGSLSDALLFIHFTGIALIELNKTRFQYAIHIVRSPDGLSRTLKCGEMSVQHAALEVLQFYMIEFTAYNPNQTVSTNGKRTRRAGSTNSGGAGGSKYKFYDVDSGGGGTVSKNTEGNTNFTSDQQANGATNVLSASARLYEEIELDKRIRKRRMRLLLAVEEAFTHVKRLNNQNIANSDCDQTLLEFSGSKNNSRVSKLNCSIAKSLDPYEAAQAVFPTLIRPLQKYMRITRQQARHPVDMVIDHLALCLAYGLSPHAFLEHFNPISATPQKDAAAAALAICNAKRMMKQQRKIKDTNKSTNNTSATNNKCSSSDVTISANPLLPKYINPGGQQAWTILTDRALSRNLTDGLVFQLRRGNDLSLLCTVRRLPLIYLIEKIVEPMEFVRFTLPIDHHK